MKRASSLKRASSTMLRSAMTTATGTSSNEPRPYRFGYGILDANSNGVADPDESKVYFEFSDYSTSYIFFENPN
jgi:hypothetical protein